MSTLPLPIAAFFAGLVSFLSPCVLPLVPGYVSLISGVGVPELRSQESQSLRKVMLNSVGFILGFSIVFIALGAISTGVGQLLAQYKSMLARLAGVVIVIFGFHLIGIFRINALYADKRLHNVKGGSTIVGAFLVGFAFALGWTLLDTLCGPNPGGHSRLCRRTRFCVGRNCSARGLFDGTRNPFSTDCLGYRAFSQVL
jgi:cytochrome c biogenesis protein CcdA